MKAACTIAAVMLAACGAAFATTNVLAGWEDDPGIWDVTTNFDGYAFIPATDPMYGAGVTEGDYALALDLKRGWTQGLTSNGSVSALAGLAGAEQVTLDVTSSQELSGYFGQGGAMQFGLSIFGVVYVGGEATEISYSPPYHLITPCFSYDTDTETMAWDLTNDGTQSGIPQFDPTAGGFLQMRLHTNVSSSWGDPGWVIIDNLAASSDEPWMTFPGDFNGDSLWSGADYVVWANNFGGPDTVLAPGSHNNDGIVSGADYVLWAIPRWPPPLPEPPVPEPVSLMLLGAGAVALLRRQD